MIRATALLFLFISLVLTDNLGRDANIVTADILASKGSIHVIDSVLLSGAH